MHHQQHNTQRHRVCRLTSCQRTTDDTEFVTPIREWREYSEKTSLLLTISIIVRLISVARSDDYGAFQ